MSSVTISSKFQIVIPKSVRERMNIKAGEKFQVIAFDNRIELVRVQPMEKMLGFLAGFDPTFIRDEDDRV